MPPKYLLSACFFLSVIGIIFFSCSLSPTSNPFDRKYTTITLSGKTSLQHLENDVIEDSVGNTVSIGFNSNFSYYLDSVQLWVIVDQKATELKCFDHLTALQQTDTSWYSMSFSDTGTKTIYGVAFINEYPTTVSDTILVKIHGKPPNHRPMLHISGQTTLPQGQNFLLTITATDTDILQKDVVTLFKGPIGARFLDSTFAWTPPQGFTGADTAVFIASDNGYPIMHDTATVNITVTGSSVNHAPIWQSKTINESGHPGLPISIALSDKCTDPDGDALTFSLVSGAPDGDAISNATYNFTPGPNDTGIFQPQIVASDSKGGFDTLTIVLTIQVPNPLDTVPPAMTLLSPSDNSSVSSNTIPVTIRCTDPSGVASVRCFMGTDTFHVTSTDSGKYSATISGLKKDLFNAVSFVAIDASSRANTDTLLVHIKYDSTITDNVPPIVTLISPSKDTIIGSDSCVVLVKATDASNIVSVVYLIGSQSITATKSSGDLYIASVKGLTPGLYSTVTITATDASPAQNKATTSVKIKCDNDQTPPTFKLVLPAKDSTSVAGNATTVQVICKDASGVASLTYSVAGSSQPMTKSANADSIWSANITGLLKGQFTTITLEATDGSLAANKASLLLHIKYDTTMADAVGPVITKISGLADNARTANPNDTLVYTITDASGVDTVSWSLNGTPSGVLTANAKNQYSINALLTRYHLDTIIITASDKSMSHNKSADTTVLDYNVPPKANDQNLSTKKNTAIAITFTADAVDGDPLSNWTIVAKPSNGDLTGTAPALTYTPKAGITGMDSLTFTVSDGKNTSNTAKIKINVSDVLVAPIAGKTIADISVNKGVAASFVATVNAEANPSPTFLWIKEGSATSISTSQTYTINQVAYSDQARYRCIVSNSQGTDTSNWVMLTVKDVTIPVITLKGANPQQMTTGATWTDPGATATDDRDGDISASIVVDASGLKTTVAGAYTVSYSVSDKAGNAAITVKRTVNVADALVAPVVGKTIADISVNKGAQAAFTATINAGVNPAPGYSWVKEGATAPLATTITYTITATNYSDQGRYHCIVSNSQGKDSTNWITLTVKDITVPVITLKGANPQQIQFNGTYSELGATASDDKDGDISSSIKIDASSVKTNTPGSYTVTYDVKDAAGNAATQVKRTVTVLQQPAPTAPTISAATAGNAQVSITWGAVTGATSYYLYYAIGTTVTKTGTKVIVATSPSVVASLTNGTQYAFAMSAVNAGGESPLSAVVTAIPQVPAPAAPTISAATAGNAQVSVTWGNVTGAASYNLYYAKNSTVDKTGTKITGATSPAVVASLTNGAQYAFSVSAVNAGGESPLSAVVKATPVAPITYTVTYNSNGGSGSVTDGTQYQQNATVTVKSGSGLTLTSFTFIGWNTLANGTGTTYGYGSSPNTFTMGTSNVNLYAQWDIRDADGNHYDTIRIGNQTWMLQNFRSTKFNNGAIIEMVSDGPTWASLKMGGVAAYCYYNNTSNAESIKKFGALYNWYAVNDPKFAPVGWHVPVDAEWQILQNYLIANGYNWDATKTDNKIAKSMASKTDWTLSSVPGMPGYVPMSTNNQSGFSGLPGGYRDDAGNFQPLGQYGYWWTNTLISPSGISSSYYLEYDLESLNQLGSVNSEGCSVRLLKD